jgi:3,4-dihydroxy 2-butanone 4-phosphate synthase/GTP cyclohydrolase II
MELIKQAQASIPTPWGVFNMLAFAKEEDDWMPHLALVHEDFSPRNIILTRIHSECITGDLFGSKRCDCGEQLAKSMELTSQQGGIVLYLRQEGRGIGIINKLKAYNYQDLGMDTIEANHQLGLATDDRSYQVALDMLLALEVKRIKLLTNNPDKIEIFENSPIALVERIPIVIAPTDDNINYLRTKQDQMGHLLRDL